MTMPHFDGVYGISHLRAPERAAAFRFCGSVGSGGRCRPLRRDQSGSARTGWPSLSGCARECYHLCGFRRLQLPVPQGTARGPAMGSWCGRRDAPDAGEPGKPKLKGTCHAEGFFHADPCRTGSRIHACFRRARNGRAFDACGNVAGKRPRIECDDRIEPGRGHGQVAVDRQGRREKVGQGRSQTVAAGHEAKPKSHARRHTEPIARRRIRPASRSVVRPAVARMTMAAVTRVTISAATPHCHKWR